MFKAHAFIILIVILIFKIVYICGEIEKLEELEELEEYSIMLNLNNFLSHYEFFISHSFIILIIRIDENFRKVDIKINSLYPLYEDYEVSKIQPIRVSFT